MRKDDIVRSVEFCSVAFDADLMAESQKQSLFDISGCTLCYRFAAFTPSYEGLIADASFSAVCSGAVCRCSRYAGRR